MRPISQPAAGARSPGAADSATEKRVAALGDGDELLVQMMTVVAAAAAHSGESVLFLVHKVPRVSIFGRF